MVGGTGFSPNLGIDKIAVTHYHGTMDIIEEIKANLMREILFVRDEYRRAKSDDARDRAKRYHDDLMKEWRELTK